MSVVIRCPNCGTTRATLGECEACGEAEVRYFCTNHSPGIWLDARMCSTCGARFGEPPRRISSPAPPPPRSASHPPAIVSTRPTREEELEPDAAGLAPWQKILAAALRARYLAKGAAAERERRITVPSAGGCLRRVLLFVVLSIIALVIAAFFFGRALLHGFQSY